MRYEDVRRASGVEGFWLRLKLRWLTASHREVPPCNVSHLSDHQLKDIGLTGFERPMDWWRFR